MVMEPSESMLAPTDLFDIQRFPTNKQEQGNLLFNHKERAHSLSDEEQLIKLSRDAGFVKTVALGQYFMTRNAEEFSESDGHFGCREYTLPSNHASSTPRRWIRESTKIGPVIRSGDQ